MRVTLIRHTSVDVPKGTCYGWTDVPVAVTFPTEAAATRRALNNKSFDAVYSSPLTRARLLAAACGYDKPKIDNRLKEINMGDWEMLRYDDIQDENLKLWYEDYINRAATNGESFNMLYDRVKSFLDEIKGNDFQHVAVFAHGGVLLCAGLYAGIYKKENLFDHVTPYGGFIEIII